MHLSEPSVAQPSGDSAAIVALHCCLIYNTRKRFGLISGRTGKGKRRATDLSIDDAARKEDEDEEVEEEVQVAGADDADDSERENR